MAYEVQANDFPNADQPLAGDPSAIDKPYEDKQAISARIDRTLSIDRFQRSLFERLS